jgi:hypothetical protein
MQQSTSCRREKEWRYGDGGQRRWQMTTVVDTTTRVIGWQTATGKDKSGW